MPPGYDPFDFGPAALVPDPSGEPWNVAESAQSMLAPYPAVGRTVTDREPVLVAPAVPALVVTSAPLQRASRGRALGLLALVGALVAATALSGGVYLGLVSIHVVSADPLGDANVWFVLGAVGAVGAVFSMAAAVVGTVWCRPRRVAGTALVASVLLPAAGLTFAVVLGSNQLKSDAISDVERNGSTAASIVLKNMDDYGVEGGPARDFLQTIISAR